MSEFLTARGLWRQVKSGTEEGGWGLQNIAARDVEDHLTDLAVERDVAESTQNHRLLPTYAKPNNLFGRIDRAWLF